MIGFSRLLDRPARAAVALLLRRDRRAADPSRTALVVVNPIAALAELDPAAASALLRAATAARSAGSTVVIARTASASESTTQALPVGDGELVTAATLSAFAGTGLHDLLTERDIDRLLIAGFPTNLAVDSTARHAVELGYHVTVLADACAAHDRSAHDAAIEVTLPRVVHAIAGRHEHC
jgi:nicotinamidase-related amidase